jgi:tRNA nucleotidyltransferase (CCA-adding enzyme)
MPFPDRLPIPLEVLRIAEQLESAGFETWCVGGAVRDNLLDLENNDFDLATAARPEEIRRLFRRTIPIGVEHGTVAILDSESELHEVTTFRRDVVTDGRHAQVEFGVSLDADLARRDFTINAIAYHPLRGEWQDPHNGQADLEHGVIRAVGDPNLRFQEDYLRILRAFRFAARFGFEIEPDTWEAAMANASGLEHLSAERVRGEWLRGLAGAKKPSELVRMWDVVGAVGLWLPELREPGGGRREVVDRFAAGDAMLLTSYLSARPEQTLRRLRCSNSEVERGRRFGLLRGHWPDPGSPASVRRWMAAAGMAVDDLVAAALAEGTGALLSQTVREVRVSGAPLEVGDLDIDGSDLLEFGIPEGPAVGAMLRRLLESALDDPSLNSKAALLTRARALAVGGAPSSDAKRGGKTD